MMSRMWDKNCRLEENALSCRVRAFELCRTMMFGWLSLGLTEALSAGSCEAWPFLIPPNLPLNNYSSLQSQPFRNGGYATGVDLSWQLKTIEHLVFPSLEDS